jgi:hypothetical protein
MSKYPLSRDRSTASPANIKTSISDTLPDLIGGPPSAGTSITPTNNLLTNSGLFMTIYPCKAEMQSGLSLFILNSIKGWEHYTKLLKQVDFAPSSLQNQKKGISIICQADSFPSDSFQNEYGESFLNQITDVASGGFGQLAQMFGKERATDSVVEMGKIAKDPNFGMIGNALGGALVSAGEGTNEMIKKWQNEGGIKGTIASTMNKLLAGARIDFPMIWKGSSYTPTFSCSIRLYNPNPASVESTKRYIVAPLAALLTIALPQSEDDNSYNYPLFCKVDCPGLFKIQAGAISNITVTKGGDSASIAYNQRVGIVDVRIDFVNLHSTLLLSKSGIETRPTLKGYLNNLLDGVIVEPIYYTGIKELTSDNEEIAYSAPPGVTTDVAEQPPSRVNQQDVNIETALVNYEPGFYSEA